MSASQFCRMSLQSRLRQEPGLKVVDELMDELMDEKSSAFAVSTDWRMTSFSVDVIHILSTGEVLPPIRQRTKAAFEFAVSQPRPAGLKIVVYIAEDLSRDLVESLGQTLDLDPAFFASHLQGTPAFRTGLGGRLGQILMCYYHQNADRAHSIPSICAGRTISLVD